MEQMLKDYSWDLGPYLLRAPYYERYEQEDLTMYDACLAYHLNPSPPRPRNADDYIRMAQKTHEMKYIFFYLHLNEQYFNRRISSFLSAEPDWIRAARYMDLKLECRFEVFRRFPAYDPDRGVTFLTYIHRYITDAMLRNRMTEEFYSFGSLQEYKDARRMMQIDYDCGGNVHAAIPEIVKQCGCTEKTAGKKLAAAWRQRRRLLPREEDDDGEDWEEENDLYPDHWDYVSILWSGMEAEAMDKAFRALSYRDQTLLEQRNAICMRCGRVSDMRTQTPFEKLAILFEGSGASGAERAYKRAVEKLMLELVKLGALHCVRLKQLSVQREDKKITAAVYAYQVDNDGAWGEIQFDLVNGTAWVESFAENDPCDTWEITDAAIHKILDNAEANLPKKALFPIFDNAQIN